MSPKILQLCKTIKTNNEFLLSTKFSEICTIRSLNTHSRCPISADTDTSNYIPSMS